MTIVNPNNDKIFCLPAPYVTDLGNYHFPPGKTVLVIYQNLLKATYLIMEPLAAVPGCVNLPNIDTPVVVKWKIFGSQGRKLERTVAKLLEWGQDLDKFDQTFWDELAIESKVWKFGQDDVRLKLSQLKMEKGGN